LKVCSNSFHYEQYGQYGLNWDIDIAEHKQIIYYNFKSSSPFNGALSSQPQKKRMLALGTILWQISIIKVQYEFFGFKSKLLIHKHGWIRNRYMKCDVLSHASLNQVVNHIGSNPSTAPLGVD